MTLCLSKGKQEKMNKISWLIFWVSLVLVIITVGIILYQKTEWFPKFLNELWHWYDGLRDFNWEN